MKRVDSTALRKAAVIFGILLCLFFSIAGTPAHAASEGAGTVTASALNMRSEPSTSGSVVTCLPRGAVVIVTETSDGWYKVWYRGNEGYVSADYLSFTESAQSDFGTGTIYGTGVRIRSGPSVDASILGTAEAGAVLPVTGVSGQWYQVDYDGGPAYVNAAYMTVSYGGSGGEPAVTDMSSAAAVTTDVVNMRSGPSTEDASQRMLGRGTPVTVTGQAGAWYRVDYNGATGYIHGDYLAANAQTGGEGSSAQGDKLAAEAAGYLGAAYAYGGAGPDGFDGSGFVYYVYKQCGYPIARAASVQNTMGSYVSRASLTPGDIILFYNSAKTAIGHAGIYLGDGRFIHASPSAGEVIISNLSDSYYNTRYYSARRVA